MNQEFIMGSETEFGHAPADRDSWKNKGLTTDSLVNYLHEFLYKNSSEKYLDYLVRSNNWWKEELMIDPDQKAMDSSEILRRLGMSGSYLMNGARLYVDGAHLEYSTPECSSPLELVAYERAGEEIALR